MRCKAWRKRVVKRFLIFPRSVAGEVRWLETAYIKQEFYGGWWFDKVWVREREMNDYKGRITS